jgi:hypothetical protein
MKAYIEGRHLLLALLLTTSACGAFFRSSGAEMGRGMSGAMVEEARAGNLDPLVEHTVRAVAEAAEVELTPRVERDVRRIVQAALAELDPDARGEELDAFARRITTSIVDTLGAGLSGVTEERIGPAIGRVLREDVLPALSEILRDDLGPATESLVVRSVRGGSEELAASLMPGGALDRAFEHQRRVALQDIESAFGRQLDETESFTGRFSDRVIGAAAAFSVLVALAALVAGWLWWRSRAQARAYEQALEVMTSLIREEAGRSGDVASLVGSLRALDRGAEGTAALDSFLDRRPHLKVPKAP